MVSQRTPNSAEPSSPLVAPGTPCWIDLCSPDLAASERFYSGLFGWQFQNTTEDYAFAVLDGQPVAGIYRRPVVPIPWTLYLAVNDASAALTLAEHLDGERFVPEQRVPGVGRKLIVHDPNGASIGLCQPDALWRFDVGLSGTLLWAELITHRGRTADHFFAQMFGYRQRQFGDGGYFDYVVWYLGEDSLLARIRMSEYAADKRPRWLVYFGVDPFVGVDAVTERAVELGGTVRLDPFDAAFGRVAVLTDTNGARFAVVDPARSSDAEYGAAVDDPYSD